ncbi:cis-3-hydroxy-L-proline dehydratase [Rhizobium sp. C4]|uniref:cis-3-hydroxy-L-proline dehydratase n=1 Tax=Rhizobium sp. C4 TaxID=1349800 RepID=UPI001E5E7E4D|nr:aconitase X [Rhizobium sp. C4]MCD2171904.1 aconitase X [Rhizobium sp. C4]
MAVQTKTGLFDGTVFVAGHCTGAVIGSDVELSFWGGVNPATGEIIDRHHPLSGQTIAGRILAIPGGRGSCTGSAVILELILGGHAPKAMIVERADDIITLGVIIAEEIFGKSIPVVALSPADFRCVLAGGHARISGHRVALAPTAEQLPDLPDDAGEGAAADPDITLTPEDRATLEGAKGPAVAAAMRIILRMARLQGAAALMDVSRVHIDGCIYTGPGSLAFAQKLRDLGGRVAVPTTLNAISVDHRRWRSLNVDPAFGAAAAALADAYVDMGAEPTFTCAPYLLDGAPVLGEQIAWAESNAVVYANSVIGARTNKYPDFLDLCIALTGRAPLSGPHLEPQRRPQVLFDVSGIDGADDALYPLLGYCVGARAASEIPLVAGLAALKPGVDDLKAFGAAFATVSAAPMFHIAGVTPEADGHDPAGLPMIRIGVSELVQSWQELNAAGEERIDLVSLGNPHFSAREIERLAALTEGRRKHEAVSLIVTCGRAMHARAAATGAVARLEAFGVTFLTDTCWCMIEEPVIPRSARVIMTNSGKYVHYGPGLTGRKFRFGSLADCVEAACSGLAPAALPSWLGGPNGA